MAFGLLMQDNTPVDYPFRRSGSAAEQSVRLGFVPGGPYYPQRAMGFVPGGPYYPSAAVAQRAQALGYVPGGPYYPRGFQGRRFAGYGIPPGQAARVPQYNGFSWVNASGGGDDGTESDSSPVPGTVAQNESTGWDKLVTGTLNLGTAITNAVAGSINPQSGVAGAYCPSGYYLNNGRCVPAGGSSMPTGLILGGVALVAAVVLLRK